MTGRSGIALLIAAGAVLVLPPGPIAATAGLTARIPPEGATADLAIEKTDSADPTTVGTRLTYTLTVSNLGPDGATGVAVIDTLPDELDFVAANPSQGACDRTDAKVLCELGSLNKGDSATVTIEVTPRRGGQIINTASTTTIDTDPNAPNDTASEPTTIATGPSQSSCRGQTATAVGTTAADNLTGTRERDVIAGRGGDDSIDGLDGEDLICGGGGNDRIRGGAGNDALYGQGGFDRLFGGAGGDSLQGGRGSDKCIGGPGADTRAAC